MKQFNYAIAAILAGSAASIYLGKLEMSAAAMALYILLDAISIAIRTYQENKK